MNKQNKQANLKNLQPEPVETKTRPGGGMAAAAFIALATLLVYYNSLNAPFVFDDMSKIVKNPDIRQFSSVSAKLIYPYGKTRNILRNDPSRPVTYLTFALNYRLGKLNPFGYHLFNVLLHILNAVLIYFLTRKVLFFAYGKHFSFFPLCVALLFAVHPINTEVVTYIYHRSESLALFFYLASLLAFAETPGGRKYFYPLSLLCFALGLFSKQTSATLPAIILLFDFIFVSGFDKNKLLKNYFYHMPYWLVLAGYILFRILYFGQVGDAETNAYTSWTSMSYLVTQFHVILRYIGLLIAPAGLCVDHVVKAARKLTEPKTLASILALACILAYIYVNYRKKTDDSKIILFGCLWFFIGLTPTSSFLPILDAMAERRLYVPEFGFCLLAVFFCFKLFSKNNGARSEKILSLPMLVIVIYALALGLVTQNRNRLYNDPFLLWADVISKYPANYRAHNNLGVIYKEQKEYGRALEEYGKALAIKPDNADTYNNIGFAYYLLQNYGPAVQAYEQALQFNPAHFEARNNLGALYQTTKEYGKAIIEYEKTLEINPDYDAAYYNLGILYQERGDYAKAAREYQNTLRIKPGHIQAINNLGAVYQARGDYDGAARQYEEALRLEPGHINTHYNLAVLYDKQKKYDKALQEYEYISKLQPDDEQVKTEIISLKKILNKQ